MSDRLFEDSEKRVERARGFVWRLSGVLVLLWALFHIIALVSFSWRDLPMQMSPPNHPPANLLGVAGAYHSYAFLMIFGGAVWVWGLAALWFGARMVSGRSLRWRFAGVLAVVLATCGILQRFKGSLSGWAGPDGVNIGIDPGARLGELLYDRALAPWLGEAGSIASLVVVLVAGLVVAIGVRTIREWFYLLQGYHLERQRRIYAETQRESKQDKLELELEKRSRALEKEKARLYREELRSKAQQERDEARQARKAAKEELRAMRERERKEAERRRDAMLGERERVIREETGEPAAVAESEAPRAKVKRKEAKVAVDAVAETTEYRLPDVELLRVPPPFVQNMDNIAEESRVIVDTLEHFGISVSVSNVMRGPVVTRYELLPAPGVKVNRVTTYSDNLQMELRAVNIRILTPIPGRGVLGIEVPNPERRIVAIREMVESKAWKRAESEMALPLILGKDVGGKDLIADLARMPHLLIAGATNSGKSACINAILTGLLLSRRPDQLRLLLVDPKRVEFMPYADLPHLVVPVITDPKKVALCLQWAIGEMDRRLKLFSRLGVRNIKDFNNREQAVQTSFLDGDEVASDPIPEELPYIVILIDEMADLMLIAQAEIENRIARLAALSRAAGIHMILATQRPSVNVITGTIKANFPGRIAFQVAQKVDSRTILDSSGAETLIGRGDMLFLDPTGSNQIRAQGAWVDDKEVQAVVADWKAQGEPVYEVAIKDRLDKMEESEAEDGMGAMDVFDDIGGAGASEQDPDSALLKQSLVIIKETGRATTSSLQRRLRIGYNRAARLMDELEQRGYIGPVNGNEPREILVDLDAEIPDN